MYSLKSVGSEEDVVGSEGKLAEGDTGLDGEVALVASKLATGVKAARESSASVVLKSPLTTRAV